MCGIAAVLGNTSDSPVHRMIGEIRHRGPHGDQVYLGSETALGCANFLDSANAALQPIFNETETVYLVADASIYNRQTIRKKLYHHSFISGSDAEAILHLYEEYGTSCIDYMDGIFAFAISDKNRLFVARDPLGVKPLYWALKNGSVYFASELKALVREAQDVQEFPPGHFYDSERGLTRYFQFEQPECVDGGTEELAKIFKITLEAAVQKRIPPNGEVGILLSGGLDSSTVATLANRYAKSVHSFAAGIRDSEDLKYARALAQRLGTRHHEYIYSIRDMVKVLTQVIYHLESFDYLLVRSSIANYLASKMAKDYVSVVLCGEGADELFAGYDHLKDCESGEELNVRLVRMVFGCHNTGLQRVDRMNMASSVEGRMPYFDLNLLRFSFTVPGDYKIYGVRRIEKWIVRKAFEHDMPSYIVWRSKQKFSIGAGSYELMSDVAEGQITDSEFEIERRLNNGYVLRNKEELMYYRIFKDFFGECPAVLNTVGLTPTA